VRRRARERGAAESAIISGRVWYIRSYSGRRPIEDVNRRICGMGKDGEGEGKGNVGALSMALGGVVFGS
jgi:hypothetical protein